MVARPIRVCRACYLVTLAACMSVVEGGIVDWLASWTPSFGGRRLGLKDYKLYGGFYSRKVKVRPGTAAAIVSKGCFSGFGFAKCTNVGAAPQLDEYPFIAKQRDGYCLQCCNNNRESRMFKETWNMDCLNDKTVQQTNVFNTEVRFARRRTASDELVIRCRVPRRRDVQQITVTAPATVGGSFQLGMESAPGQPAYWTADVSNNAVGSTWEELVLKPEIGMGPGESMETKLGTALTSLVANSTNSSHIHPNFLPLDVTRIGPSAMNAHTWRVTFSRKITDYYDGIVPLLQTKTSFNVSGASVSVTKVEDTHIHGYYLTVEVAEENDGLDYWRSVTGCSINITEKLGRPKYVMESLTLQRSSANSLQLQLAAFVLAWVLHAYTHFF